MKLTTHICLVCQVLFSVNLERSCLLIYERKYLSSTKPCVRSVVAVYLGRPRYGGRGSLISRMGGRVVRVKGGSVFNLILWNILCSLIFHKCALIVLSLMHHASSCISILTLLCKQTVTISIIIYL